MIKASVSVGITHAMSELRVRATSCGFEAAGDWIMGTEFDL